MTGAASAPEASTFLRGFQAAWGVLALLCLPLCVLQQIDALLVFSTLREVLRDVAVMVWLCALPAATLSLVATLAGKMARSVGLGAEQCGTLRWALILVPVAWLATWQFARASWQWVKLVSGHSFLISPSIRYAVIALIVAGLAWGWWRLTQRGSLGSRVLRKLDGLRWPLATIAVLSLLTLVIGPPRLAQGLPAPTQAAHQGQPHVVILTLDALSAVDADLCGDGPTPLPHLRTLAAESVCYSRLYSVSNFTTPTTSTIETGTLPWTHLASQISAKPAVATRGSTLAAVLREAGYRTYTTSDNVLASARHRGTDGAYMRSSMTPSRLWRDRVRSAFTALPDTSVPLLVDSALSFLGAFDMQWFGEANPFESKRLLDQITPWLTEADTPAFVWVHSMPPHSPYLPPSQTKYRLLPRGELERWGDFMDENNPYPPQLQATVDKHRLRYRESIMAVDAAVGDLIDQLRRSGQLDRTLLIVSSDHGESFEKGFLGHAGPALHEALIRVPLLIRLPNSRGGQRVEEPVSQVDIAPTVTDVLGLPRPSWFEGRSLTPQALASSTPPAVFSMAMERQSRFRPLREGHYAVIEGRHKLVRHLGTDQTELFDLQADPGETTNLADAKPEVVQPLRAQLDARLARAEQRRAQTVAPP